MLAVTKCNIDVRSLPSAWILFSLLLALIDPATAQPEVDRRYVAVDGPSLLMRFYNVPPAFLSTYGREGNVGGESSAQIVLERAGVTFGAGASARYFSDISLLVVCNTEDEIERTEAYLGVGDYCVRIGYTQVATIVEVIEIDRSEYLRLQGENPLTDSGDALRRSVQKAVRSGDAQVLETLAVTGRSGQSAIAVSSSFEVYPSADNAPITPAKVKLAGAGTKLADVTAGPTAWESRAVGRRLEVSPTVRDSENDIDLSMDLTITGHDKRLHTVWPNQEIPDHERREIPTYDTRQVSTDVLVTDGSYALIAVWKPTDKEERASMDRVHLVFVRADVMLPPVD